MAVAGADAGGRAGDEHLLARETHGAARHSRTTDSGQYRRSRRARTGALAPHRVIKPDMRQVFLTHVSSSRTRWPMQLRAPLSPPRDRKGDRTRERLFQAALDEFRARGFENASVGQIAQRAGTSRASFYFYYPCKDAVLLDLQWRLEMAILEHTREQRDLRDVSDPLIDALCAADTGLADGGLLRIMLSVYIRQPAGARPRRPAVPPDDEVGAPLHRRARSKAACRARARRRRRICSCRACSACWPAHPDRVAARRDDMLQLAALFLADGTRARERRRVEVPWNPTHAFWFAAPGWCCRRRRGDRLDRARHGQAAHRVRRRGEPADRTIPSSRSTRRSAASSAAATPSSR